MLQPAELKSDQKLMWSPGRGTDVWALIQACTSGDLEAVRALIARDPSLARAHYDYRKPLYFAVRENRIDVVRFLLEHDRNPIDLWVDDDAIEIARDRGYTEMEQLLTDTLETRFNASPKGEPVALALRNHDLKRMRELLDAQPELVGKGDHRSNQPIHWATMTQAARRDRRAAAARRGHQRPEDGRRPADSPDQRRLLLPRLAGCATQLAGDSRTGHGPPQGARRVHRSADGVSHRRHRARARIAPAGSVAGKQDRSRTRATTSAPGRRCQMPPRSGAWTSCELLLDHGADPNLPEEQIAPKGKALYSAVFNGHYEIAKLLLERGAFPNPPVESSG